MAKAPWERHLPANGGIYRPDGALDFLVFDATDMPRLPPPPECYGEQDGAAQPVHLWSFLTIYERFRDPAPEM